MAGYEDSKRANFSEESHLIDRAYDSVDLSGKNIVVSSLEVAFAGQIARELDLLSRP